MKKENFNEECPYLNILNRPEYNSMKESIGDDICLLVVHGSRAYGTNHLDSDFDIKGVYIESVEEMVGLKNVFDKKAKTFDSPETDIQVHPLNKFLKLALKSNPTILEILFVPDDCVIYANNIGKCLLQIRDIFLTQNIKHGIKGFAKNELYRVLRNKDMNDEDSRKKLYKSQMHCLRLIRMGTEALEGKGFNVKRTHDLNELVSIRNGKYEDKPIVAGRNKSLMLFSGMDDFNNKMDKEEKLFNLACVNSKLPEEISDEELKKLNMLIMSIYINNFDLAKAWSNPIDIED